jgi:prepilin peptidase CpaA
LVHRAGRKVSPRNIGLQVEMSVLQQVLVWVFPALVIVAALKDVTSFTIPNWISGVLIVAFLPAALSCGVPLTTLGIHLLVGLGCLVAGIAMFALGWIGGGDAKLFAAAGLWLGLNNLATFLLVTALAGGALALLLVKLRSSGMRTALPGGGPTWVARLMEPKGAAPYGVAIAFGALAAFPQSTLFAAI